MDRTVSEDVLRLKDGRMLGYGIYGNPAGIPVIDFHGIPGSRREAALIADFLDRDDLCLIGFDRPGYGRSSPRPGAGITDLPGDVAALADHLHLERFIALGFSGGAPFALACAWRIPERIAALGIVSGIGPAGIGSAGMHASNRRKFDLARQAPWLARAMLWLAFSRLRRRPGQLPAQLQRIWAQMPEPDRQALQDARFAGGILAVTGDAIHKTVSGWVHEELLMAAPWGFDLPAVRCSSIHLWHGSQDRNVPLAMGRAVAAALPGCQAAFLEEEGHLSLLYNHGREIVDTLLGAYAGGTSSS
jgi:pimeloyl-ACP methyl ester carboxylesterase